MLIQTNFIAGKMNKSVDERLVPVGEYVDAMNVRLGSTETTEIGAVENSRGNTLLTNVQYLNLPLSTAARCIGAYEDGMLETIYWFVHDPSNPVSTTGVADLILSYNTNTGTTITHVASEIILNFDPAYLITGVDKINDYLYFTDDINPPRYINITRNYGGDNPASPAPQLVEEDISVIVKPPGFEDPNTFTGSEPLGAPFLELIKNSSTEDYLEMRFLSFAYRYRYQDGGYSATSLFTNPAFEPQDFKFNLEKYQNDGMINKYNQVDITFSTGSRRVVEIQLLYKESAKTNIYIIQRLNKADLGIADNIFISRSFTNSKILSVLGSDELLRLYDNVPRTAKAQTIQGNRLMYGNYVDQYNITENDATGNTIPMVYSLTPHSDSIGGANLDAPTTSTGSWNSDPATPSTTLAAGTITFDCSLLGTNIPIGTELYFNFALQNTQITDSSPVIPGNDFQGTAIPDFSLGFTFICPNNFPDVNSLLTSADFEAAVGTAAGMQPLLPPVYIAPQSTTTGAVVGVLTDNTVDFTTMPLLAEGDIVQDATTGLIATINVGGIAANTLTITDFNGGLATLETAGVTYNLVNQGSNPGPTPNAAMGGTLTDRFNTAVYNKVISTPGNYLKLYNTSYDTLGTCPAATLMANIYTPIVAWCTQQPFRFTVAGNNITFQAPAAQYFYNDLSGGANAVTNQFNYFTFNIAESSGSYSTQPSRLSLHSDRDYEIGVVYMDEYARASTVLTSQTNTVFFGASKMTLQNKIQVELSNLAPYWAEHYKFVIKPSQGTYNTIWSNIVYQQDGGGEGPQGLTTADNASFWFRLEGDSQNLIKVGDVLTVKTDALGPTNQRLSSEVLDKEAMYSKQITAASQPGLYMRLKPSGWQALDPNAPANIACKHTRTTPKDSGCSNACIRITECGVNSGGTAAALTAGSSIFIRVDNSRAPGCGVDEGRFIEWEKRFVCTQDYNNIHAALLGEQFVNMVTTGTAIQAINMSIYFDPALYGDASQGGNGLTKPACQCFNTAIYVFVNAAGEMFVKQTGAINFCYTFWPWGKKATNRLEVEVTFSPGLFCFESETQEVDPNIFYDASDLLDISPPEPGTGNRYHLAATTFNPVTQQEDLTTGCIAGNCQDQTGIGPANVLRTILPFGNCYVFGNGVESFRIEDRIDGKFFLLGERAVAVSNQDFKEADRFAGMTYSGVFSGSANSNNLNEFNLGLVNFKDCETRFGPIMKLHSRETDILCLQEDKITYVLAGKNVVTDSTGGGAIVSVPEVLGQQIARIEEFGISFNPESFASWGPSMFFTDTKRGAVLMLQGASANSDQLSNIATFGMRSWFRDQFNVQLTTQKLGGYDPYMNEYVLSTNDIQVPVPLPELPCGQEVTQLSAAAGQTISYVVDLGAVIGTINIPYTISGGTMNISVTWDSVTYSSGVVGTSGSFSFNKTSGTPHTATVVIETITGPNTYGVTVECPTEVPLTIVEVVVNSQNYFGEGIHTEFNWNDGSTFSPTQQTSVNLNFSNPTSYYFMQTGVRSVGMFPYDGANITLRTNKIAPDTFDFNPSLHRFKILSSNTLYGNNTADIQTLLTTASDIIPITNPSIPVYEATETSFNMPVGNQYLYLVWDFRDINCTELCYETTLPGACCDCETACTKCFFSPQQSSQAQACLVDTDTFGWSIRSYSSGGTTPVLGDVVYADPGNNCDVSAGFLTPGYYIVDATQPASLSPKKWIEIGPGGIVIQEGTC